MNDAEEKAYLQGSHAAWLRLLRLSIGELRSSDEPLEAARLLLERTEAVAVLRQLCAVFGDNQWDPDLHLADVIDKHLGQHLHAASQRPNNDGQLELKLRLRLALTLGWRRFPYLMPDAATGAGEDWWCPPGSEVHVRNAGPLPELDVLLVGVAQLVAENTTLSQTVLTVMQGVADFGDELVKVAGGAPELAALLADYRVKLQLAKQNLNANIATAEEKL